MTRPRPEPASEPTEVNETALWTLGILWTLFWTAVGIGIGSQHTAGLAIRDHEDAVYYQAMADTLLWELQRCGSVLSGAVHTAEGTQLTLQAYLGRRVVVQTVEVDP